MSSTLCCNPIDVDDEIIDRELEEVWEIQRTRSRNRGERAERGGGTSRGRPKLKILAGNNLKRGRNLSISRDHIVDDSRYSFTRKKMYDKRSMSTGRMKDDRDRDRSNQSRNSRVNAFTGGRARRKASFSGFH